MGVEKRVPNKMAAITLAPHLSLDFNVTCFIGFTACGDAEDEEQRCEEVSNWKLHFG